MNKWVYIEEGYYTPWGFTPILGGWYLQRPDGSIIAAIKPKTVLFTLPE